MSITTIFLYILYSIILFLILEYLNYKNKLTNINTIAISLIYLIIVSGITPNQTNNIFLVIIIELLLRIFYINHIQEKDFLKTNKESIKTYFITIILSYILNITFINKVETTFPTGEELKIIVWLVIIIFIYKILKENININELIPKEKTFKDKEEYIVSEYAKLKSKYYNVINPNSEELIPIIYAIMIYENYYKPKLARKLDLIKFKIDSEERKLGIMQVKTKKIITDEESIEISIKKLEKISTKLSSNKKIKKEELSHQIIKEYTKKENSYEEILDIYNQIIEFNKK